MSPKHKALNFCIPGQKGDTQSSNYAGYAGLNASMKETYIRFR